MVDVGRGDDVDVEVAGGRGRGERVGVDDGV